MSSSFTGDFNNFLPLDYIIPEEVSELNVKLRYYLNDISAAVNSKDSGLYDTNITITGQQFIPTYSTDSSTSANYRDVLRVAINTGPLPNTGTSTTAHGITFETPFSATRIYGAATDPNTTWIPLPFASPTLTDNISITIDATNINITTGSNRSNFTRSFVIIEWITTI